MKYTPLLLSLALPMLAHGINEKKPADAVKPAAPAKAPVPPKPVGLGLKDGDRFIFIGDSITHQCMYSQYVEDFYYTRYPQMRLRFRNAGVSGDRAADALDRFDDDIAAFKPTVATILLGMNDGAYQDFNPELFAAYSKGMLELMNKLDAMKCRVILMGPTMFDHQSFEKMPPERQKNKTPTNYNAVLAYYSAWQRETARQRGYLYVDMYSPLNTVTVEQRKTNKDFTLVADAIHPAADGQLMMAYAMIDTFGEQRNVFSASMGLRGGQWAPIGPAGAISAISGEPGKNLTFTFATKALPWVVTADATLGAQLIHVGHHLSQEALFVSGLNDGRYDLNINGSTVGTWNHNDFGRHVEIEEDHDSPTWQLANRIAELNAKRNAEAVHPLRDLYGKRKGKLRDARSKNDMKSFEDWQPEFKAKAAELEALALKYEDEIYTLNKIAPLKIEIKAAAPLPPKPAAKAAVK
jgi:lysophospholipase L1-like esterase